MKRVIYATATYSTNSEVKDCAKYVRDLIKQTKTPFTVTLVDPYSDKKTNQKVKLNAQVSQKGKNSYFVNVEYNLVINEADEEESIDFLHNTIDDVIDAAIDKYPMLSIGSKTITIGGYRGRVVTGITVRAEG